MISNKNLKLSFHIRWDVFHIKTVLSEEKTRPDPASLKAFLPDSHARPLVEF